MRFSRMLALGASMLALASAPARRVGAQQANVKIGSDGFDEATVMAEAYAQVLEANGYTVDRDGIGLGDRKVTAAALESGQIDLQPEYIGSALGYTRQAARRPATRPPTRRPPEDPQRQGRRHHRASRTRPAQDTNAFVVRKETADKLKLTKMSDVAAVQDQLKLGLATDCPTNPRLRGGRSRTPTASTPAPRPCSTRAATPDGRALKAKHDRPRRAVLHQPDIIQRLRPARGRQETQPADNIAPLVRNDYLAKTDKAAFTKLLDDLSAKIDTATLADLYKQVSVDKKDIKDVVSTFLKAQGLVK